MQCFYVSLFLVWHVFPSPLLNQLGKVNELLIKHNVSDLAEEKKEEDVVQERVEEETGLKADCVFTAENLEAALNLVMFSSTSVELKNITKISSIKMIVIYLFVILTGDNRKFM